MKMIFEQSNDASSRIHDDTDTVSVASFQHELERCCIGAVIEQSHKGEAHSVLLNSERR